MNVPLLDLVAQYRAIKDDVLRAMMTVIERQAFIMGPEMARAGDRRRGALPRQARHRLRQRHRRAAAAAPGAGPQARRRGHHHGVHVLRHGRDHPQHRRHAGLRGHRRSHVQHLAPRHRGRDYDLAPGRIVVVHLFGQMAPMEEILPIARQHGLPVIEDAAQSIGARRKVEGPWRVAGELGTVGTLSFFPSKNLGGWGDGGMIVTQDDALAERLRRLRLHGGAKQYYPRRSRVQQPARYAAGRGAAGEAAAPGRMETRPAPRTLAATPRPLRVTPRSVRRRWTRSTSTSSTSTPSGCPGGTSCRRTSRRKGIGCAVYYPARAAPAAVLRLSGLSARGICR